MIIIDECSMIGPKGVANISHTSKQINKSKINDLNNAESTVRKKALEHENGLFDLFINHNMRSDF